MELILYSLLKKKIKQLQDEMYRVQGPKGDKGDPFSISKIYKSINEMNADFDNPDVALDAFVIIEDEVHTDDNGKLYIKGETAFEYVTDLSTGTMITGPQGDAGVGVPSGGEAGQMLIKTTEDDFATEWVNVPVMEDILPQVNQSDDDKVIKVVNGKWQADYTNDYQVVYSESSLSINGFLVPKLSESQTGTIYNAFVAGKNVVVTNFGGTKHYKIISVDSSDEDNITIKLLFEDKMILTYNKFGNVSSYVVIPDGQVVVSSREYQQTPNERVFVREWSPNANGKVWAECTVFITTVALSVGSRVNLPVTFTDEGFSVQVTPLELGSYNAVAYRSGSKNAINVQTHDYYGTPKSVKVCVKCEGWKQL